MRWSHSSPNFHPKTRRFSERTSLIGSSTGRSRTRGGARRSIDVGDAQPRSLTTRKADLVLVSREPPGDVLRSRDVECLLGVCISDPSSHRRVNDVGVLWERPLDGGQRSAAQAGGVPPKSTVAVLRCGTGQTEGPTPEGAGPLACGNTGRGDRI